MRFQLISLDEYRSTSIIGTFNTIAEAVTKARDAVTDANVRNALAGGERERSWEAYFVDFFDGDTFDSKLVYAGNLPDGRKQKAFLFENKGVSLVELADKPNLRIYLGELEDGSPWYFKDHKGRYISNLEHEDLLSGKTLYFVQSIK